jgi:hypothetical protein
MMANGGSMKIVIETRYCQVDAYTAISCVKLENGTILGTYFHNSIGTFTPAGARKAVNSEQDAIGKVLEYCLGRAQRALAEAHERTVIFKKGQLDVDRFDYRPRSGTGD